jgi:glycosyltransferase involved in cell wall biosynthesis
MSDAVLRLLGDDGLQRKLSAAARAVAVEKFAMEPMIDRWEAYYATSSTPRAPS